MGETMKGFRLSGKALPTTPIPRAVIRMTAILESLPNGDLLTTNELAGLAGYTADGGRLDRAIVHALLAAHRLLIRYPSRRVVWGNKSTIAELAKHKEILA